MSWLGEQFSSFTEKITDITKEILIDDSGTDKLDPSNQSGVLSYKDLLELCKEKDQKINSLISEKEYLESSIEELDQQHQEAINAILFQKNQVIAENNALKRKLASESQKLLETIKTDYHSSFENSETSNDLKVNSFESQSSDFISENINLISILQSVSDCSEDEKFKKQIDLLEKQRNLINIVDKNASHLSDKIDNYINFLEALHSQSLYSVVDDICSIFNSLESDNNSLKEKIATCTCNQCNETVSKNRASSSQSCNSEAFLLEFKTDAEAQTDNDSIQILQSDVSIQTLILEENNSSQICFTKSNVSKQIQTELVISEELSSATDTCSHEEFLSKIADLEKEKLLLQENVCHLESLLNKVTFSVDSQTDNDTLKNIETELVSTQWILHEQKQAYDALQEKYNLDIKNLNEKLLSTQSIINEQNLKIEFFKEKTNSLEEYINSLKQKENNFDKKYSVNDLEMSVEINSSHQHDFKNNQTPVFTEEERSLLLEKLKNSDLEKSKLLCVLNEKTQECSTLKAEVHKLTSIVASEKQALLKLQQDNFDLKQFNGEKSDPELTKEAIKKLSAIIRDKDLEIDSLTQKNSTLTTLIQNDTTVPEHLQSLLEEKDKLKKQVLNFKSEREKIMLSFNAKDKEWRECVAEVKKLNKLLTEQRKKYDVLEQNHHSVAQQYEEKQKLIINTQNEIIILKQRINDLEQQLVDVKGKHSDLLNSINSNNTVRISTDELNEKNSKIEKLISSNVEKDHLIQEKDCMIHDLSQQVKKLKIESEQHVHLNQELQEKISTLTNKLKETNINSELLQREKLNIEQRLLDKASELELLKEMNERLNMAVKEKEFAIQSMTEKVSSLSQYICSDTSSTGTADVNQILADSESMFSEAQKFRRERDETLLALNQSKQDNQSLRNEIQRMKSNEIHLENQLSRLRQHLLEVEENYTNEAIKAEEREKVLKDELVEVKRRAEINSTAVVDTNQRASIQIASLQEQLSIVANQRDEALSQVSLLEDKVLQHSTAVNKLQLVLEQLQKSNERKIKEVDNKWLTQLESQKEVIKQLEKQLQIKQMQLEESSKALEAASRLSEQLDAKEEIIINLKNELSKTENQIKTKAMEINSIKSNTEGKVDRVIMKSLVLGYFSTPPEQKSEVIRLLARVLDFNQEEMQKAGIVVGRQTKRQESRGIFSTIFNRLPSLSASEPNIQQPEKSFTTLFVQFLENESQPIVPMPFPAEKMAQEQKSKTQSKKKTDTGSSTSSRPSPLLIDIDSAFPTFTPVPAIEYSVSPAPAILKEVLE